MSEKISGTVHYGSFSKILFFRKEKLSIDQLLKGSTSDSAIEYEINGVLET